MSERPLIGVTGSRRRGRIMTFLNRFAVWRAGGRSVAITWDKPFPIEKLDGLVIGGGDDISATLYGGALSIDIRVDERRDKLEMDALEVAEQNKLPVLGICRGSQILNVFYGGNLFSEISEQFKDARHIRTVMPKKCVDIVPNSTLQRILNTDSCFVNSLHHQAVDRLGDGFDVAAKDEHDMIQAVERPGDRFLLGVQWHPEFLFWQPRQQRLFKNLVDAAREKSRDAN